MDLILKNFLIFCLFSALASHQGFAQSPIQGVKSLAKMETTNVQAKKLIIIGDSVTEGYGVSKEKAYPALLEAKIKKLMQDKGKAWNVVNSGLSGSTSASGPARINWALKSKPDLIILALGANDGLRGLKVEETEKNLDKTIRSAKDAHVMIILAGMEMPPNYGKDYRKKFSAIFKNLAKKHQIPLIPFLLENVGGVSKLNLADGIHPNEEGHQIVAENVFKIIKGYL